MLASSLLWLVWRRWRRRRDAIRSLVSQASDAAGRPAETAGREGVPAWRPILIGGLILAVASVSSVAATRALPPPGNRDVLRTAIVQPFDPRDYASPLAGFRRYLRFDRLDQEMLRVSGLPEGARIRIATLDSYDGIVFAVGSAEVDSASGTFVRIPSSVDQSAVQGDQVRIDVEITGYRGGLGPHRRTARDDQVHRSGFRGPRRRVLLQRHERNWRRSARARAGRPLPSRRGAAACPHARPSWRTRPRDRLSFRAAPSSRTASPPSSMSTSAMKNRRAPSFSPSSTAFGPRGTSATASIRTSRSADRDTPRTGSPNCSRLRA